MNTNIQEINKTKHDVEPYVVTYHADITYSGSVIGTVSCTIESKEEDDWVRTLKAEQFKNYILHKGKIELEESHIMLSNIKKRTTKNLVTDITETVTF